MAAAARIIWHVETSAGPRFDWADDEEDLRRQLIEYNNDVLNDDDEDEQLDDDATLEEAIEQIEDRENFSREDMHFPKMWVRVERQEYHLTTAIFLSRRAALDDFAAEEDIDIAHLDDDAAQEKIERSLADGDFFQLDEVEIQA